MMRSRLLAASLAVGLSAVALTGCVRNLPEGAVGWLGDQSGIVEATVLADNTGPWSSSGLVRGELEPGLSDVGLSDLLERIGEYQAENGAVGFWLGRDEIDFVVTDSNADTVSLWERVSEVPGLVSGIVADHDTRVRVMRADAVAALGYMDRLEGGVRMEAFADEQALAADYAADIQNDQVNVVALEYRRPQGCTPDTPVREFAESLVDRAEIPGATIDLCAGITLDLPATASIASSAVDLRNELDERGLSDFPVQLNSETDDATRFAAITPGDPAVLAVLAAFEQPGVPSLSYSLGPDGNLAITGYDTPTSDLLALMQGAPAASRLIGIGLEGDPVAILGPLDVLPALLAEATALDAASDTFGSVQLGVGFGSVFLESPVGSEPDVAAAVAAIRASGSAEGRFFSVRYKSFQVDIANDVAALTDPGYVDAEVMHAFVETWNGG